MNGGGLQISLGPKVVFEIAGIPFTNTLITGFVISLIIVGVGILISRRATVVPGRLQALAEMFIVGVVGLIDGIMPNQGRRYLPMIGTIFLFIGFSNLIGTVPFMVSPTSDINVTVSYAIVVFLVSQYVGVKSKGIWPYIKAYFQPVFVMAPLNIISELAKPVSHAFRLFGNMLAGAIIIAIAMYFIPWVIPVALMGWFNLFSGFIQAFIFGILAIVYISVQED